MHKKLALLAMLLSGVLIAGDSRAGSTVLEFDDLPGPTNDPVPVFFGSNAATNTSGTTVTDGDIDGADFPIWQVGLGLSSQTNNSNGDADRNGTVRASDLVVWNLRYGGATPHATINTIPEPAAVTLVWLGMLVIYFRRSSGLS